MEPVTPDEKLVEAYVTLLSALPPEAQKEIISRLEWALNENNAAYTNEADMKNVNPTEAVDPS